jgi:HK97 family phage portal protein
MKNLPFDFPEREPIRNDIDPVDSSLIVRGTSIFEALGAASGGLMLPTELSALTISAVYASINLIAGAISALPVSIYGRQMDGELDRLPSDDLHWVLNEQMTPRWSAASGWEFLVQSLLMHGDAFARIIRKGPLVAGLEPLHPLRVYVMPNADASRLIYVIDPDPFFPGTTERVVLDQDDVLHVAGFGFNGFRGLSPLRHALRMTGAVSLATQEYAARFFANSARPDVVLETDQKLGPDTINNLRDQWQERHQGPMNAHKPAVLTSGLSAKVLSLPVEDLQLLEIRQFQIEEIARIYGIPPFMIGHNEKTTSWGSGVEAMGIGFVRYTLRQHLNKFQNELNRKLFRTAAKVAEFDTTDLERADLSTMMTAFRTALGRAGEKPIMSVNEVRHFLRLNTVDGGDSMDATTAAAPKEGSNAPDETPQPPGQQRQARVVSRRRKHDLPV